MDLTVRLEALRAPDGLIQGMTDRLDRLVKRTIKRYQDDWNARWNKYEFESNPLRLMRNAPRDVVELLKVNADILPGVICKRRAARRYNFPRELVHVLGNVGQPDPAQLDRIMMRPSFGEGLDEFIDTWFDGDRALFEARFDNTVAQQYIGKEGVEGFYDEQLTGLWGARSYIRDAVGRTRSIEYEKAPVNSKPLTLTIDMELQRDIIANVEKWEPKLRATVLSKSIKGKTSVDWSRHEWKLRGAAVVLDVKTGNVLAMVSFPDYDPQKLSGQSPKDKAYSRMLTAEFKKEAKKIRGKSIVPHWKQNARMMNRALRLYAPGSTFKILSAIALLEDEAITTFSTIDEPDSGKIYGLDGKFLGKTNHGAGNNVDMLTAIERSSNGYFYTFSQEFAPGNRRQSQDQLQGWAETFGVGRRLNSDFYMKQAKFPSRATPGGLAQFAIGQGQFVCTPMEIARLYAAVANRGTLHAPRLSNDWRTWPETTDVSSETWDIIHEGMRRVVFGDHGTANKHPILRDIECAGKTGTAQNGHSTPDHAWFAGFAPYDKPEVAFVMLASYSDLYGADVSPVIAECIQRYLERTNN
ncbi:MAG: hypothetical protein L3J82_01685 [Planctomycetes bacterium]|nr:hypothetical protein [Planctomycetota bacterium]